MAFKIKLKEERGRVILRDGSSLDSPVIELSANEFKVFQNKPRHEDPMLIIEEVKAEEAPAKKKRGRPKKVKTEITE